MSPAFAFDLCGLLYLLGALCIARIRVARVARGREPVSFASLFAGIRFIRAQPIILGAISLDLFAVLLGGATALLPICQGHPASVDRLGILRAAPRSARSVARCTSRAASAQWRRT